MTIAATTSPTHHLTRHPEVQLPDTYNQGVARVSDGWILSGTNYPRAASDILVRTDEKLVPKVSKPSAIPAPLKAQGYVHIGDIDVVGDIVYAPLEQRDFNLGHQRTARYNAKTLAFIDSVELAQHENSFVAVDPKTMIAWSQDHFDGDTLLRYDIRAGWKAMPPLKLSETLHHTQGAAIAPGEKIWISTSDPANDIYLVDMKTGAVELVGTHGHAGGEGEGIDAHETPTGQLHTLVNDPDFRLTWFEQFAVSPPLKASGGGSSSSTWLGAAAVAIVVAVTLGYVLAVRRRRAPSDLATAERQEPVER
jgi:hypothetical protein